MKFLQTFLIAITAITFCAGASKGQSDKNTKTGILIGQTRDCYGDIVKGARIEIKNEKIRRKKKSDKNGFFKLKVPEGNYEITVERCGFKKQNIKNVIVWENLEENINVFLEFHSASHESNKCNSDGKICRSLNK